MNLLNINYKDIIFALDIGTRSIIGTVGVVKDKKFNVICEKYIEHQERAMVDGQIHDITLVANSVAKIKKSIEEELNLKLNETSIAAAGRFLRTTEVKVDIEIDQEKEIDKEIIRSLELTAVKKAEEETNKQTKGKLYCVGYSVKNYYLNGYVISNLLSQKGEKVSAEVIVTFLPRSVVDSLYSVMDKVELNVKSLTLEPIAAMEAAVPKRLRLLNLALVDVGAGTSDIAISSNDTISAYGMVPMAGDEITEVIAQNYLVDFNTAELMKKECTKADTVKYIDVLGIENEISSEEIIKIITPTVEKISDSVAKKIIELNGGKSPNAVFLVGGGAHTPNLKENVAQKLNLPLQRIAIKGRDAVSECTSINNKLGSIGVTVLGIALVAIRKSGNDFIDVILNNEVISLFNSRKHTVMDVMIQAGISHKVLMVKNGKNIRFMLNGIKRVAFGTLAKNASIMVNEKESNIDTEIGEGDNIQIIFAKDGKDASPKLKEYVKEINCTSFYVNDIIQNLEPAGFINNMRVELEEHIKEGVEVKILVPSTLGEYIKYFQEDDIEYTYYLRDKEILKDYHIKEGDRIYKKETQKIVEELDNDKEELDNDKEELDENKEKYLAENKDIVKNKNEKKKSCEIEVLINNKPVKLKEKDKYVFIDIFDYIDFDLSKPKGNLMLILNDKKAGYYDKLNNGDSIKIFWEKQ
ncbi:rod shape-determining protein [Clostridium aestuarii]|uniref:Rod shape-determining protein n=1 Tax=Clostridium aestuarii TaxID=338193 RepID=A0ABT4D076_9CLOT|nr:cell division FtsA domain-containing protein [Clostridium aestuarii]MCY6484646.1 rod shape-determining protein [Clostridium aestuarii]